MLDKPTKDQDPAPGWRFPRFLRFGDNGDTTTLPKARKPPQEPEERKQQPGAARLGELLAVGHASECFGFVKDWVEKKIRRHMLRARNRQISRTALSCLLRLKAYGAYPAGAAFGAGRTTRSAIEQLQSLVQPSPTPPRPAEVRRLVHLCGLPRPQCRPSGLPATSELKRSIVHLRGEGPHRLCRVAVEFRFVVKRYAAAFLNRHAADLCHARPRCAPQSWLGWSPPRRRGWDPS